MFSIIFIRSFETHLSRVEAELLRREAPPSYGQLIAQGLIPPVEDFPVCSSSQVMSSLAFICIYTIRLYSSFEYVYVHV